MQCPVCGHGIHETYVFCPNCGASLARADESEAQAAGQTEEQANEQIVPETYYPEVEMPQLLYGPPPGFGRR